VGSRKYSTAKCSIRSSCIAQGDRAAARITQLCERQDRPRCCHRHACLSSLQESLCLSRDQRLDLLRKKTAKCCTLVLSLTYDLQAEFLHVTHKFLSPLGLRLQALLRVKAGTTEENDVWKLHGSFQGQLFNSLRLSQPFRARLDLNFGVGLHTLLK
jgi:hypothetical protein